MKRAIEIPGKDIDMSTLIADTAGNAIFLIPRDDKVIVVFAQGRKPVAREMTVEEAATFKDDIVNAYQSLEDESVINEMEKRLEP